MKQTCNCCKKPVNKEQMEYVGLQEDHTGIIKWELWNCECNSTICIPIIGGATIISFETKKALKAQKKVA